MEIELEIDIEEYEDTDTDDRLINDVLCFWDDEKSKWKQYSKKELTAKFLDERMEFDCFFKRVTTDQWH